MLVAFLLPVTLSARLVPLGLAVDSTRIRRVVQSGQAAFERDRRRVLPVTTGGLGRCEERIGRFCYWYDETEPPPPPEPQALTRRREQWLGELSLAATQLPGDGWIAGQLVRYLVEAGRPDSAAAAASRCRAEGWWCLALAGFANHAGGHFVTSDSLFRLAMGAMPPGERCRWNDLEVMLEPPEARDYGALDCRGRDSANAVLLWRGQPRQGQGPTGNDLRTEILSRRVILRSLDGAVTHHGIRLGHDLAEVVLRYGWAEAYGRRPDRPGAQNDGIDVVGHEPKPAYPLLAPDPGWPARLERPRFRYAPRHVARIDQLRDVQLARFWRGSSVVLVGGYQVPLDSVFPSDTLAAALVVSGHMGNAAAIHQARLGRRGSIKSDPVAGASRASLELFDPSGRGLAVYRSP
ncbi:MAG: hypothetical protein H6R40_283, partial [Gemmatimonadetes bacterium]|nr:hypothetical protein [Gemmatimonadota bacterium]